MNIQSPKRKLILFYATLAIITFFITCRKIDYNHDRRSKIDYTAAFFKIPVNTNPTIRRLAETLKAYNKEHEFVSDFVKKHGLPKWDKCPQLLAGSGGTHKGEGGGYKDTVAFVPITNNWSGPGTAERVVSFLAARLTADSIQIRLFNTDEYAGYGLTDRVDTLSGELIASMSMYLEVLAVPDRDSFRLVDDRLFASHPKHADSARIMYIDTDPGGQDKGNLMIPVETTNCITYCEGIVQQPLLAFKTSWVEGCQEVLHCYSFWSFIIQNDPGMTLTGGGGTGTLGGQVNCSLYPQGQCGIPPNLGWVPLLIPDDGFDPYSADTIGIDNEIRDSFPCVYNLIKNTLYNPNIVTQVAMQDFFTHNMKAHVYFKISDTMDCLSIYNAQTRPGAFCQTINGVLHWTDTIELNRCFLQTGSREMIIAVLLHEPIHAYILWCVNEYWRTNGAPPIDSTFMKNHFGIYWESMIANKPYNHEADHNVMVQAYIKYMANIIAAHFNPNAPPELKLWVSSRLAAEGLQKSSAWGVAPGVTDTCNILGIQYWGRYFHIYAPNDPHTPPNTSCRSFSSAFRDSLQMVRGDSCL